MKFANSRRTGGLPTHLVWRQPFPDRIAAACVSSEYAENRGYLRDADAALVEEQAVALIAP